MRKSPLCCGIQRGIIGLVENSQPGSMHMRTAPCIAVVLACGVADSGRADVEITRFNFDTVVVGGRNLSFVPIPDNSNSPPGPGAFPNSSGDLWGVVDENINDDVLDDSLNNPLDLFGILPEDFDGRA